METKGDSVILAAGELIIIDINPMISIYNSTKEYHYFCRWFVKGIIIKRSFSQGKKKRDAPSTEGK